MRFTFIDTYNIITSTENCANMYLKMIIIQKIYLN